MSDSKNAIDRPPNALGPWVKLVVALSWILWFGGMTFYAAVVIPVGSHITSVRLQGFVTQNVSNVINGLGAGCLLAWLAAIYLRQRPADRIELAVWGGLAITVLVLVVLHPMLDQHLEGATKAVADPDRFYRLHQYYLWGFAIQWLLLFGWTVRLVRSHEAV